MVWDTRDTMSLRRDFVALAVAPEANIAELCRRFNISRKTGYKWIKRFKEEGDEGLADRSRRPHNSPKETSKDVADVILELRDKHPAWGGRKLKRRLEDLKHQDLPAASTISGILKRNGRIDDAASRAAQPFTRFEREAPNELWQMDFKGHFALGNHRRCHPLTILDDHSRFSIGLRAMYYERGKDVQRELKSVFRRYGIPEAMLMDNGAPWGSVASEGRYTWLNVWLMELGIRVLHTRPRHPQTNGKDERFHRTLDIEVLRGNTFANLTAAQASFDPFRQCYNHERPHEALDMDVPASRYRPSPRAFPEQIAEWEYPPDMKVRKVDPATRTISWKYVRFKIGQAFGGRHVGVRATTTDGLFEVYFRNTKIKTIDLRKNQRGDHRSSPEDE